MLLTTGFSAVALETGFFVKRRGAAEKAYFRAFICLGNIDFSQIVSAAFPLSVPDGLRNECFAECDGNEMRDKTLERVWRNTLERVDQVCPD